MNSLLYIGVGAAFGASLRWLLGLWLNPLFANLSFGTLIANYIGCLLMGIIMAITLQFPQLSEEWRLFLITGFLGSLTTFSAFSGEVVGNFLNEKWLLALGIILLHLIGCLLCTFLGMRFWRFIVAS